MQQFEDEAEDEKNNGNESEAKRLQNLSESTVELLNLCSLFLRSYVLRNTRNQLEVYKHLELIIKAVDSGVTTMSLVAEVFRGNETLLSHIEGNFVAEMADQIAQSNHNPDYLGVLAATIGGSAPQKLQSFILRELTQPGREHRIMFLCADVKGPEYEARRTLSLEATPPDEDDGGDLKHLPQRLEYHIILLNILTACAVGTKNMNLVEAKLQSLLPLQSLVAGMLDPTIVIEVRVALTRFLTDVYVDAEMKYQNLDKTDRLWDFFETIPSRLEESLIDVLNFANFGQWGYSQRTRLEFLYEALGLLRNFAENYPLQIPVNDREGAASNRSTVARRQERFVETLSGVKELFEAGASWFTDCFLVEMAETTDLIIRRAPFLTEVQKYEFAPNSWSTPPGLDLDALVLANYDRQLDRAKWTLGK